MADLQHEFALTTDGVSTLVLARFRQWGIPPRIMYGPRHHVGVAKIVTSSDGFFEFHEDGRWALIVPEGVPEVPGWDSIEDLVAFFPDEPGRWWRRRGEATFLSAYNQSPWQLSSLTVHEQPLTWLQAGCTGICILNWGFDPNTLLGAGQLLFKTQALRTRFEHRITEAALAPFNLLDMEARYAA